MSSAGPVRSCAACRTRRPQFALMRIVRSPEGAVCLDRGTRRSPGRGAYLCSEEGCLRKAQRALSRALRVPVSDALLGELAEHAALRRRCAESDRPADSGGAADS